LGEVPENNSTTPVKVFSDIVDNSPEETRPTVKSHDAVVGLVSKTLDEGNELGDALREASELGATDLTSPDAELKILYAVMQLYLKRLQEGEALIEMPGSQEGGDGEAVAKFMPSSQFDLKQLRAISKLAKDIVAIKEAKSRIESNLKLDPKIILAFVEQIFVVVNQMLPKNKSREILTEIWEQVVLPGQLRGEYTGEVTEVEVVDLVK